VLRFVDQAAPVARSLFSLDCIQPWLRGLRRMLQDFSSISASTVLLLETMILAHCVLYMGCGSPRGAGADQPLATADAGQLVADPPSLTFGTVAIGDNSSQTVTVTASGEGVTILQGTVTGPEFSLTGPVLPVTLRAGQHASFAVRFTPSDTGPVAGRLSLASDAPNSPTTVAISGTGTPATLSPPSHWVTLTWGASTSMDVVGYYVYRGTNSGGPYTRVAPSATVTTSYTDSTVVTGTTYFYVVTAVDGDGNESAFSNQASAIVAGP